MLPNKISEFWVLSIDFWFVVPTYKFGLDLNRYTGHIRPWWQGPVRATGCSWRNWETKILETFSHKIFPLYGLRFYWSTVEYVGECQVLALLKKHKKKHKMIANGQLLFKKCFKLAGTLLPCYQMMLGSEESFQKCKSLTEVLQLQHCVTIHQPIWRHPMCRPMYR